MHPLPEYMMVELMNTITDKVNWQKKIFDEAIVQKWRDEIVKDAPSPTETANSSNAMNAETGDSAGDGAGHQVQNQNVGITEKMFHEVNLNLVTRESTIPYHRTVYCRAQI